MRPLIEEAILKHVTVTRFCERLMNVKHRYYSHQRVVNLDRLIGGLSFASAIYYASSFAQYSWSPSSTCKALLLSSPSQTTTKEEGGSVGHLSPSPAGLPVNPADTGVLADLRQGC